MKLLRIFGFFCLSLVVFSSGMCVFVRLFLCIFEYVRLDNVVVLVGVSIVVCLSCCVVSIKLLWVLVVSFSL